MAMSRSGTGGHVTPPPSSADTDATSDIASLLSVVRGHQRQHADAAYDAAAPAAIARCKTMLSKLRKLLPKLLRPIAAAPAGVPMLRDLCEIVELLLDGSACPHARALFIEGSSVATHARRPPLADTSLPSSSYPTFANMLFYMVSFYSNARLQDAQASVLRILCLMALFLQQHDTHGFLHFFRDTVDALEDALLLEAALRMRRSTCDKSATIAAFLTTASHVYQDADGPLGARSLVPLCGCEPTATAAAVHARQQQLKALLPPIRVDSYSHAVELRFALLVLAQQLVRQSGATIVNDPAMDRLVRLVPVCMQMDDALERQRLPGGRRGYERVGIATHTLLCELLHVTPATERTFVRLTLAFYASSSVEMALKDPHTSSTLVASCGAVLRAIRDGRRRVATLAHETLWTALCAWITRSLVRTSDQAGQVVQMLTGDHCRELWLPAVEVVVEYVRSATAPPTSSSTAVLIDLLACVDVTALDADAQSLIVEALHRVLSSPSWLLKFVHAFIKALKANSFEPGADGSLSSTSRKRTRNGVFVGASRRSEPAVSDSVDAPAHEKLAQWVLDLVFFGSDDATRHICALSLALRVVLPFRDWIASKTARADSAVLVRVFLQRVDNVASGLSGLAAPSSSLSADVLGFVVVLLRHFEDGELAKYSAMFADIVSTVESKGFFAADEVVGDENDTSMTGVDESWDQLLLSALPSSSSLVNHMRTQHASDTDEAAQREQLFAAAHQADVASRVIRGRSMCARAMLVIQLMWSRVRALRLHQAPSWRDTWLWRPIARSVLNQRLPAVATQAAIATMPLLVPLLSAHCRSPSEAVNGLLELLVTRVRDGASDVLQATILETASSILCVASRELARKSGGADSVSDSSAGGDRRRSPTASTAHSAHVMLLCRCWEDDEQEKRPRVEDVAVVAFATVLLQGDDRHPSPLRPSSRLRALRLRLLVSFFQHCDVDADSEYELLARFHDIVDGAMDDPASCQVVSDLFGNLVAHPHVVHKLLTRKAAPTTSGVETPNGTAPRSFLDTVIAVLTRAEASSNSAIVRALLPVLGALGCACDASVPEHMDVLLWALLRVVAIWSKAQDDNDDKATGLASGAFDQIQRIVSFHETSWRKLCVGHPEQCYFALTDELLSALTLRGFLRTFMPDVDATAFLFASAPHVLPIYIVDQNEDMLHAFVAEFNGTEDDSGGYEDGSEGDDFRTTSITELLLNHVEFVLKELILDHVKASEHTNREAAWDFLLKFMPENTSYRDLMRHSPLRLLNLVAWELGGSRCELAKKAFRVISHDLSKATDDDDDNDNAGTATGLIPRQYFLAMMTELGNKISAKASSVSSATTADKIRAIKSVSQLFGLFADVPVVPSVDGDDASSSGGSSSGVMDPFVPKVMAILKLGLGERELQDHAMHAWAKFLRILSVKALESNLCSIVVSVLPCLGYDPSHILEESTVLVYDSRTPGSTNVPTMHDVGFCWNVNLLQHQLVTATAADSASERAPSAPTAAFVAAVGVLTYLFIEKRAELTQAFPRIPMLPWLPALRDVHRVLVEDTNVPAGKPLGPYLVDLASYVNHWDVGVREVALSELFRCLVVRGHELRALMENEGDLFVDRAVVALIVSILQLARTESQESVKLLCARCLGALGAIDAARMPLNVFYDAGNGTSLSLSVGGSGSGSGTIVAAKDKAADARVEHSTKDLACVLIETWLVKELRAAPENTDAVAFAIQELLKFLAELTADPQQSGQHLSAVNMGYANQQSKTIPAMPEWMKRRFERKDVMQFIEPYWSTSYSIATKQHSSGNSSRRHHHPSASSSNHSTSDRSLVPPPLGAVADDSTYYEKYSRSTYEEWLVQWCKRLIQLSQPPERKIFWACQTALPTCPQIARFLLPYLLQNVLRSGKADVHVELKREIMAVLSDHDRGVTIDDYILASPDENATTANAAAADDASRHHQCSQTIFSTIEELNEWVWASEKKRRALSSSSASASVQSVGGSARSVEHPPSELDDQEKENLDEFLKDIPSRALSTAAFGIEAYARAIQYFEVYLRQQDYKPLHNGDKKKKDGRTAYYPWPVHLALIAQNAFYLQQLYKSVDEPDALVGLATLRRLCDTHGFTSSSIDGSSDGVNLTDLMHEIVDFEQLAQWEDALACYEQAIQEIQTALSARAFVPTPAASSQFQRSSLSTSRAMLLPRGLLADPQTDPELVKPELYSGMVGCLIQLGRLESALQHINGIVTQEPELVGTLFPYALECAWRLSRWELLSDLLSSEKKSALLQSSSTNYSGSGDTSSGLRLRGIDGSQLKLIRVLHSLHRGELESFQRNLNEARLEVMGPLAAASTESYQRAYPLLHKLHFLHEVEQGFLFLRTTATTTADADDSDDSVAHKTALWTRQCAWDARYDAMPTTLKYRDPILALRRVLLQDAGLKEEVSRCWLLHAKLARKQGYVRTAASALMHAEALDNQYAMLERAKLLVSQDRVYEALQLLEPVNIDAAKIVFDVEDRTYSAKTLLLATNWMHESGLRQGKKVVARYEAVIKFDKTWENGYFFLAKYYEYLLSVSHPDAAADDSTSNGGSLPGPFQLTRAFHTHLIALLQNYVLALEHGSKFVFQSLPRLLTLWFEYGELFHTASKASKLVRQVELVALSQSSPDALPPTPDQVLTDITSVIVHAVKVLPAYEWLVCFPQVTSRICHPNAAVVDGVKKIMVRVLSAYPTQAMWPLLGLSRSLNTQRRTRARDIIAHTQRVFSSSGQQEIANSFSEGMRLVEELISLAGHDPANQRKIHIRLTRIRTKILVPVQAALTTILPASGLAPPDHAHAAFSPHAQVHIRAFSDKADVMLTKEKPKRIEVLGSDGRQYPFLCKREKTGDLRKDARMMEFNTMINKLLQKDGEGRKRKLRLRTYAVVCLNEESGLLEWVRNTKAMRQLIAQIQKTERGFVPPVRLTHEIKERFLGMQKRFAADVPGMADYYRRKVLALPTFTPRFHQWFANNFADPSAWLDARLAFARSAAVWSMVGHIIGLGDRHGENILVDCTSGECVHVDFDCLFDKGLKLAKPELVPFRLTPNLLDAFGITGCEGTYRRVCEVTMRLLRAHKATLRSVLESFVHDPLVEWGRKGKAAAQGAGGGGAAELSSSDRSKEETRVMLRTIDDRLRGIYNLGAAIRPHVSSAHRRLLPESDTLPLSVQGQVDKLIHEATSHENLAQMYIGWMPFL